jgi:hypothetical protein
VEAPSPQLATKLAEAAEEYRKSLAVEWLGHELPPWEERCPIDASIQRGAGGETSFYFTRGRVHGWKMKIQGSPERMLDSVLPHEVTHTIFATHFGCPLPRWADEGACTTVEHPGEVARMEGELIKFLKTRRGIRFSDMMWMKQYPRDFMPLYAQGHSVAAYLIGLEGKQVFVRFLEDGLIDDNWPRAAKKHYGYANLAEMQEQWLGWVRAGRPLLAESDGARARLISDARPFRPAERPVEPQVARGQDPDSTLAKTSPGQNTDRAAPPPRSHSAAVTAPDRLPPPRTTQPIARLSRQSDAASEAPATTRALAGDTRQAPSPEQAPSTGRTIFQWQAPMSP